MTIDKLTELGSEFAKTIKVLFYEAFSDLELKPSVFTFLWFSTLSQLFVDVFATMPAVNETTLDDRMKMFEEFVKVTRTDLEKTIQNIKEMKRNNES